MLTQTLFNNWWTDFSGKYPACRDYVARQQLPTVFLDGVYQSLAAFDADVLGDLTGRMLVGEIEPIPNTQLGQLGNELRTRCREVLEIRRSSQRQEWEACPPKWSASDVLNEPHNRFMLHCAMAVDALLGDSVSRDVLRYGFPGGMRPSEVAYDAAIVMADNHTPVEEATCLATFSRFGLTWEQIQAEANRIHQAPEIVQPVPVE